MDATERRRTLERISVPEGFERRPSRAPVLLLALIVLGAFLAIGYTMFTRSVVYYKTPTEVQAMPGQHVRVSGRVVGGSIVRNVEADVVTFALTDGRSTVPVRFEGPAPDTLKDGADAVAEGSLGPDGTFHADKLFAKCPSKFQSKAGG
jgi:cytochrome c-type biogenesis protein CcmE